MTSPVTKALQAIVFTGFSSNALCCLALLAERIDSGGTPAYAQIAEGVRVSYASARRLLDELVDEGLIEKAATTRYTQARGTRRLSLRITDAGRALLAQLADAVLVRQPAPTKPVVMAAGQGAVLAAHPAPAPAPQEVPPVVRELLVSRYGGDVVALAEEAVRKGVPVRDALSPLVSTGHLAASSIPMIAGALKPAAAPTSPASAFSDFGAVAARMMMQPQGSPPPATERAEPAADRGASRVPLARPDALPDDLREALPDIQPTAAAPDAQAAVDLARTVVAEAAVRYRTTLATAAAWLPQVVWSITRGELADLGALPRRVRTALRLVATGRWQTPRAIRADQVAVMVS